MLVVVLVAAFAILMIIAKPPTPKEQFTQRMNGSVKRVVDGDTLLLIFNSEETRIRLAFIDAPESRQDHGAEATASLRSLLQSKAVMVETFEEDRYGRTIARLWWHRVDDDMWVDLNLMMIESGFAWHYVDVARGMQTPADLKRYQDAESNARSLPIGLWAHHNPMEPWDFRRGRNR